MGGSSKIEWCDSTFNPWIGCTKISPACDNCYAADWSKRYNGPEWGDHPRRRTKTWNQPKKWQREADAFEAEHGRRRFVFCASLADVFDNQVPSEWRNDLWRLIKECDRLVWLLLTKRPQNIARMLPDDWGDGYPNVWLGTTVETQKIAARNVYHLLNVRAAKRFLSIEPMLGPIDLTDLPHPVATHIPGAFINAVDGMVMDGALAEIDRIDWVIAGGESGPCARPAHPDWYRLLRDQCVEAGVPFHFKQWGEWMPAEPAAQPPYWNFQNGDYIDGHLLPDFDDPDASKGWDDGLAYLEATTGHAIFKRVGKKAAGRLLDGRTWDDRPALNAEGQGDG